MGSIYKVLIMEHYKKPHNYGVLKNTNYFTTKRNFSCGDEVTVFLKFDKDNRLIDIKWNGRGCAISIAAMSILSDMLIGLSKKDIVDFDKELLFKQLGIPLTSARDKCVLIGLEAVKEAANEII